LAALLHRDQTLAGHVVRVANSPAYLPCLPILSLQQAISRLGITAVSEISFAVALQGRMFDVAGYENDLRQMWAHAIGTAAAAKEIARLHRSNGEGAFLCGLLHDIGKPVLLQMLVDLRQATGLTVAPAAVNAILEAYHTQVGGRIADAWALPPHVTASIVYHHDFLLAPLCADAAAITCLANRLSHHLATPSIFDEDSVRQHPAVAELHFSPDDVDVLFARQEVIRRFMLGMA
jgi:putative nucleotidyltransferase with HDIG domain